jgi:Fur family transcriptional regulator, ferric uptake regulator
MRPAARKRKTRQLDEEFKALQGDDTHPFAHEIYRRVHKKLPRISLATVYRNLHSLVEEGKIRTLLLVNR